MASQEMRDAAEHIRADNSFKGEVDIDALRAGMHENLLQLPEDISTQDLTIAECPARHVEAPGARNDCGVLYFHGGGYVLGSLDTHHELMGRVARACRAPVLGLDYRLAPEHIYPAAVDDAVAAYKTLLSRGLDAKKIVLGGDSAGGGLALACMQALLNLGEPLPAGAILFSPWTDLSGSSPSRKTRAELDPMLTPSLLDQLASKYRGETRTDHPGVSPLFGELSGLPALLVQVGDHEILLDDSTRLADKAKAAGVDVEIEIYDGAFHVFQNLPELPESADALTKAGSFFDRCVGVRG